MNKMLLGSEAPEVRGGERKQDEIHLIVHGKHAEEARLLGIVAELQRQSPRELLVRPTSSSGHAVTLAREAAAARASRVIAIGGDGTVNEVVKGLMSVEASRRPSLGIVPYGTANDFAGSAGISLDIGRALIEALTGATRAIDVGCCRGRWFLNMVSGGVLSEATAATSSALKELMGGLAYAIAGLMGLPAMRAVELQIRGQGFEWSGASYAIAIGNARTAGGGFCLCPEASVVDGQLDVTIVPAELSFRDVLALIDERGVAGLESIPRFRSPWIEFEVDVPLHVNVDGEPHCFGGGRIEVLPGALEVVLPSKSPLLGPLRAARAATGWPAGS